MPKIQFTIRQLFFLNAFICSWLFWCWSDSKVEAFLQLFSKSACAFAQLCPPRKGFSLNAITINSVEIHFLLYLFIKEYGTLVRMLRCRTIMVILCCCNTHRCSARHINNYFTYNRNKFSFILQNIAIVWR